MEVKITVFSDTHCKHKKVTLPPCDIAIFCGDMSSVGYKHEVTSFFNWFARQYQCLNKVVVLGNHDRHADPRFFAELRSEEWWPELLEKWKNEITYLENSGTEIFGLKIWGSPVTPYYNGHHWSYNKQRGEEIRQVWQNIPRDTDILITHCPVAYKLDCTTNMEYLGCEDLRHVVKMIKPKLHCCGHIHEGYGTTQDEDTIYVNGAVCNYQYQPINKPVEITLDI